MALLSDLPVVPPPPNNVEDILKECAPFVDYASLETAGKPLRILLPEAVKQGESQHLMHTWQDLQLLMRNPDFSEYAKATMKKLRDSKRAPELHLELLPVKDRITEMQAEMPGLTLERVIAVQSKLFERYSHPEFQNKLFNIYCSHNPRTAAYKQKLSELIRPIRESVLPKFGFVPGTEGDVAWALALSEFHTEPDVQTLMACIDEILYTSEAPMVENSKNLTKKQILDICREQMTAFRDAEFQRKLRYLKAACRKSWDDDCYTLEGRSKLALAEQQSILTSYGLDPSERGVHSLLHQFAQYIMDPEVATYSSAVNMLLGMEPSACDRFNKILTDISVQDPCPLRAQSKPAETVERVPQQHGPELSWRRSWHHPEGILLGRIHSYGGQAEHKLLDEPLNVPWRRRRSLAEASAGSSTSKAFQDRFETARRRHRQVSF